MTALKNAMRQLENQQAREWILLKKQSHVAFESLKPLNIIKNTFKEALASPGLKGNVLKVAVGLTAGIVAKNLFVWKSQSPVRNLLGSVVEMVVAGKIARSARSLDQP